MDNDLGMLLVWFFFSIVCYFFAKRKNRSPIAWAIWGFFGSAIAFIVLLILPKKEELYMNSGNNSFDMTNMMYKKCPYCAEQIMNEAIVCKHCNRDIV